VTASSANTAGDGKENRCSFRLRAHFKKESRKRFKECQKELISRDESVDSTTSFLSALSLQHSEEQHTHSLGAKRNTKHHAKASRKKKAQSMASKPDTEVTIESDAITLDDICNDAVEVVDRLYDPESLSNITDPDDCEQWPSWVPKRVTPQPADPTCSPSKKRKRDSNGDDLHSPPSKKQKSPHVLCRAKPRVTAAEGKGSDLVMSTARKSKRRSRRRSSIRCAGDLNASGLGLNASKLVTPAMSGPKVLSRRDQMTSANFMETPVGSIRTQRIHRLTRKSNTDLLMEVLLREDLSDCIQIRELDCKWKRSARPKITFDDLSGLRSVGRMDSATEKTCLFLLKLGADPLWLNQDGVSPIFVAMHYSNSFGVLSVMIRASVIADPSELNQTYVFAKHGTLSLLDIALRIGEAKTVRLCLENDMMATPHSVQQPPTVQLLSFCKKHRMTTLCARVLREQFFESVDNLDIEYLESILCHGVDVNVKMESAKTALYSLVEQPFDVYDAEDARDQYDTIECLLKNGADPNSLDLSRTPMLIFPLQRSGRWNIKLVDLLLFYRANLKLKVGETSKTLYQYAKDNCVCDEILKIIDTFYKESARTAKAAKQKKNAKATAPKAGRAGPRGKGRAKPRTVEVECLHNPELEAVMQTKNVVKKAYKRNRKTAKHSFI